MFDEIIFDYREMLNLMLMSLKTKKYLENFC